MRSRRTPSTQPLNNVAVPITVQVPIGIAANVCPNVNAAALAQQLKQQGTATCKAENATQAFANQVIRQEGLRQAR